MHKTHTLGKSDRFYIRLWQSQSAGSRQSVQGIGDSARDIAGDTRYILDNLPSIRLLNATAHVCIKYSLLKSIFSNSLTNAACLTVHADIYMYVYVSPR